MQPRPKVVWFQLGIRNDEAAKVLEAAGITVVQDRCMLAEHRRLKPGAPARR
jgi:predicted CoA-binding protein